MSRHSYNVLILCTGNSARSILGEALVNRWGAGRFRIDSTKSGIYECSAASPTCGRGMRLHSPDGYGTDEARSAAEPAGLRQAESRSGDVCNSRLILNAGLAEHIGSAIRLRA